MYSGRTSSLSANSVEGAIVQLTDKLSEAVSHHQRGELAKAEELYTEIVTADPRFARAWHLRGVARSQQGDLETGVQYIRKAIEIDPQVAAFHFNLGRTYKALGQPDEAIAAYRQALVLDESLTDARNNLGNALQKRGDLKEAAACFSELIRREPESANFHYNLANVLSMLKENEQSIASYRRAIAIRPDFHACFNLAHLLNSVDRFSEADAVWETLLTADPANPLAQHMVAASTQVGVPLRAGDEFIRFTFDESFAESFDAQLAGIGYCGPALALVALKALFPEARGDMDVLDAGCGTGLCGPLLRPFARRLVGVDLSEPMLEQARARGCYDETIVSELTACLVSSETQFDLIVSTDTLIYFGDLAPVLKAASGVLRTGGVLIVSVEECDFAGEPGFRLERHGRYSHARSYIERELVAAGFNVLQTTHETIRTEHGKPVAGLVVTARRTEA